MIIHNEFVCFPYDLFISGMNKVKSFVLSRFLFRIDKSQDQSMIRWIEVSSIGMTRENSFIRKSFFSKQTYAETFPSAKLYINRLSFIFMSFFVFIVLQIEMLNIIFGTAKSCSRSGAELSAVGEKVLKMEILCFVPLRRLKW